MCGITGELNFKKAVVAENISKMVSAIAHRGPDDEGIFCNQEIGLGHRRLAIIDLSPAGHQPMWTSDKSLCIVFSGEVYNYREIRPELEAEGYNFKSNSDTEVVLNAIHFWGIDKALQKFIGMFAFALWDARERCLLLARDRAGIKPLFYANTAESFLFASELKALYAHPCYVKRLNSRGLGQFFVLGYTLDDATVFSETYRVPAAHYLKVAGDRTISLKSYWDIDSIKRNSR